MKTIRELTLEFIHKNQAASVTEISAALHVTRMDIRYHLKQLTADGKIERFRSVKPVSKGRPTYLYRIPSQAEPNNYRQIAKILLSPNLKINSEEDLAVFLANEMAAEIPTARQQIRRINQLMRYLNDHGYRAGWEAFHNGPRIIFRNCPYAEILGDYPELCKMDRRLLEMYLSFDFEQVQKIDRETGKYPSCIFTANHRKLKNE
ncbi:MAG TPA: FaeA/PapI family transcriptional regulator [Anaerolineaceae bacterium]|nr:FaeA/PapI family transcriptional regulator [Anaerolineaceae bacterium]